MALKQWNPKDKTMNNLIIAIVLSLIVTITCFFSYFYYNSYIKYNINYSSAQITGGDETHYQTDDSTSGSVSTYAAGSTITQEFNYTGNVQTFVAPYTTTYTLTAYGAVGGYDGVDGQGDGRSWGGNGGYVQGTINLTAGQTLYIYVGGKGDDARGSISEWESFGGYNGGADTLWSGAGGGATDFRINGQDISNRILVAGGGGGRYQWYTSSSWSRRQCKWWLGNNYI